jgi:signal transduction histidine kinase
MSHEIRTPMNAIFGFTQLLQRDATLTSSQQQRLETINQSGVHLLRLINDVLEMAKIEAGRVAVSLVECDLRALLVDLMAMFRLRAQEKGLGLSLHYPSDVPSVIGADATKLRQVLVNLLGNAVKFTLQGRIEARVGAETKGRDEGNRRPMVFRVEVQDTGPGIAQKDLNRVFEPFEQSENVARSFGGSGLGLTISQRLARMMRGDVTVTSQPGVGRSFRFTFNATACE